MLLSLVKIKTLSDLSSSGTLINGKKIAKDNITFGDKITIGPYTLVINTDVSDTKKDQTTGFNTEITGILSSMEKQTEKSFIQSESFIEVIKGPDAGKKLQIHKEKISIGKSQNSDFILTDSFVSRNHGEIFFRDGDFFIRDLDSRNGLVVDGKAVPGSILYTHSKIGIGKSCLEFVVLKSIEQPLDKKEDHLCEIVGKSEKIRKLYPLIKKAARCDATILIFGETGTGKELLAKTIHSLSTRKKGELITLDCSAIPKDLIESELFGHEKGAFTSAHSQRRGAFEKGDNSTIFLDEIGELPISMQPKLLRILEEKKFKRVGGEKYIPTHIRVIAATNRDLNEEVKNGNFRADLYYRLFVIPLTLPPLRERVHDIPLLVDFFLKMCQINFGLTNIILADEAQKKMMEYSWPGNIRELRNVIERAVAFCDDNCIQRDDIQFTPVTSEGEKVSPVSEPSAETPSTLAEAEKQAIIKAITAHGGNKKKAAQVLGIAYSTLCEKVKKYTIAPMK